MAAFGFKLDDYVAFEVWPECWDSVTLFHAVGTQWRVGMSGPVGLDYNVLFRLLDRRCLEGEAWHQQFVDVQVMESEALNIMRRAK